MQHNSEENLVEVAKSMENIDLPHKPILLDMIKIIEVAGRELCPNCTPNPCTCHEATQQMAGVPPTVAPSEIDAPRSVTNICLHGSVADFYRDHHCYELIPTSSKLIVLDVNLNVKKAFYALVYNGVRAGVVWDRTASRFIGLLTITDFIKVLCDYTNGEKKLDSAHFEKSRISDWRSSIPDRSYKIISINEHQSLYDAITVLRDNRIHRLPVIDPLTNNVLCILTHKRILKFLYHFIPKIRKLPCLNLKVNEMEIGAYSNIHTVTLDTPLIDVFFKFVKTKVSAFPIVDENNCLVGVYSRFDVLYVMADGSYANLDAPLRIVLQEKEAKHGVIKPLTVHRDAHLNDIFAQFVKFQVHRLIVVDSDQKVQGIISLSDMLGFFIGEHNNVSPTSLIAEP